MKKLFKKTGSLVVALSLIMGMVFALSAAAQDVDVKINFQRNLDREAPDGYLIDAGEEFGDRDNGYEYGWNFDHSGLARDNNQANEDRRLATHTHFNEEGYWTINLPNGTYEVTTSIGDSAYPTGDKGKLILLANDTVLFEYAEDEQIGENEFDTSTVEVKVTDGTMVLSPGDSANKNVKINYIDIKSIALDGAGADDGAADADEGTADEGTSNDDNAAPAPDMPKTGLGGTSNGMTSATAVIAILLVSMIAVLIIRRKKGDQA